jgi:predicted esterase YcpF (UPF0227 family)
MAHLLYIHGFLSSPESVKAVQVAEWLRENRSDIEYHCPFLTPYPEQTRITLETMVQALKPEGLCLMGSSLGGFWATWLAEKYDLKAVLINPAVELSVFKSEYINSELKNYHTQDTYYLTDDHVEHFRQVDTPTVRRNQNYWLMVQTGDETLDYRLAINKYRRCRQLVEEGGDHSFRDFCRHIPAAIEFLTEEL